MFVKHKFTARDILNFSGKHILLLTIWASTVTIVHELTHWKWMAIPWLPISVIGTAVAFYVGFKNNQAYDRLWEARKIWGAIVNSSRAWGSGVKAFVTTQFAEGEHSEAELQAIRKKLIYRHIGWLYALRNQLLIPTSWEHINQGGHVAARTAKIRKKYGVDLLNDKLTEEHLLKLLPPDEYDRLINYKNTATQIIDQQAQDLKDLRTVGLIDDFRHMEMQQMLYDFYIHQGKAERIKKFPLPRQYGNMSTLFVYIFIFLLPFGMTSEFDELLGHEYVWMSIPLTVLVGWVYIVMELIGDYSENPFEGLGNDIPMLSLCRVIEIDLLEMLGETDLPPGIEAKNGVLM